MFGSMFVGYTLKKERNVKFEYNPRQQNMNKKKFNNILFVVGHVKHEKLRNAIWHKTM
jgi:hypothetical protein